MNYKVCIVCGTSKGKIFRLSNGKVIKVCKKCFCGDLVDWLENIDENIVSCWEVVHPVDETDGRKEMKLVNELSVEYPEYVFDNECCKSCDREACQVMRDVGICLEGKF